MPDSPGPAWAEPPDEPVEPCVREWLKRNNAPKCMDCGGPTVPCDGPVYCGEVEFRCVRIERLRRRRKHHGRRPSDCRTTWVNIHPLSQREREQD